VYFAVTEGQGELPVRLDLIDVDEERTAVFGAEGCLCSSIPGSHRGVLAFERLEIPEPGEYRLRCSSPANT